MKPCPCSPNKPYMECCGLFINRKTLPLTPEQLMRSRFSAYATVNIDYIKRTMQGPAAEGFNKKEAEKWAKQVTWLELKVLAASMEGDSGSVEFIARYAQGGIIKQIHERSEFLRQTGKWYYVDGEDLDTIQRTPPA